jgi:hypothetical protein
LPSPLPPWLQIEWDAPRPARHIVPATVGGAKAFGILLYAIPPRGKKRTILALRSPEGLHGLPAEVKRELEALNDEIINHHGKLGILHMLPAAVDYARVVQDETHLTHLKVISVCERRGVMPALVIAQDGDVTICILPEKTLGKDGMKKWQKYGEHELAITLRMFEDNLEIQIRSCMEQAAHYFTSICFGAGIHSGEVLKRCLRIRQLIGSGIDGPRGIITRSADFHSTRELGKRLETTYDATLRTGEAFIRLSHGLIFIIFRLYCMRDISSKHLQNLQEMHGSNDAAGVDPVELMKRCGTQLQAPTARFVEEIHKLRDHQRCPTWLLEVAETCVFMGEVVAFTKGADLSRPWVFVSRHFRIHESDLLEERLREASLNSPAALPLHWLTGRTLERDLRWSLLARIWFADHHVLFLPPSLEMGNGKQRKMDVHEWDWAIIEMLYSWWIGKERSLMLPVPRPEPIISALTAQVENYTTEPELPQLNQEGWQEFADKSRNAIATWLRTAMPLKVDATNFPSFYAGPLQEGLARSTVRTFVESVFVAWSYRYWADTWSFAQAAIELHEAGIRHVTATEISGYVRTQRRHDDPRFAWTLVEHPNRPTVNYAVGKWFETFPGKDQNKIYFLFDNAEVSVVDIQETPGEPTRIRVRARDLFDHLVRRLGVPQEDHQSMWESVKQLILAKRHDDPL